MKLLLFPYQEFLGVSPFMTVEGFHVNKREREINGTFTKVKLLFVSAGESWGRDKWDFHLS